LNYGQWHHRGDVYLNGEAYREQQTPEAVATTPQSWHCRVADSRTTILANFGDADPNRELAEINVRELIGDLAQALEPHRIRLLAYLPSGAPAADPVARRKLQWRWGAPGGWQLPGEPVGGRLAEFQRNWEAVCGDWSQRWGRRVSGWWIDGCYFADEMYRHSDEPNFASFARALKAGNPGALVAFNPGVKVPVVCHTPLEDYTAGEVNLDQVAEAIRSCPGRWIEREGRRVQFQILSFLGQT
ncbi:MAG TPA: hypothetical protein P5525_15345, partial [Candidatus Paceibacterota bacterium]|nr:hypothetical protein [Candidatus Paceibacterota bacterium]